MGDQENREKVRSQEETLFYLFVRCAHLIGRGHHQHGFMHPGQLRILAILAYSETMSQRELQEIVRIRSASLSEILKKIEGNGLIKREKDEKDRRNVVITITEKGKALVAAGRANQRAKTTELFSALRPEEQEKLQELLRKLIASWQGSDDDQRHDRHERKGRGEPYKELNHEHDFKDYFKGGL